LRIFFSLFLAAAASGFDLKPKMSLFYDVGQQRTANQSNWINNNSRYTQKQLKQKNI